MRYSKYRAVPTFVDGIRFASKKEAKRYQELKLLEKAGEISDLSLQHSFLLSVGDTIIGKYVADFVYKENGKSIIEDTKGVRTPVYKWKKKHFEAQMGIKIKET